MQSGFRFRGPWLAVIMALLLPAHANAQSPRYEAPQPIPISPGLPMETPVDNAPKTLPDAVEKSARRERILTLEASLAGQTPVIDSGLVWRIYTPVAGGEPALVAELFDAHPVRPLPEGNYIVHVSYGFASAMARVALRADTRTHLRISAGALRITGVVGTQPIPPAELTFSVYLPEQNNPEGRLVVANIHSGETVRLPAGDYHVVSNYGTSNAIARTDLTVEEGKVTDATVSHRAATVTLKLVAGEGSEAFAGTAFSVLTPGGDTIHEEIATFPTLTLAEGDYVVVARHEGQVYSQEFSVESGKPEDIEIVAR